MSTYEGVGENVWYSGQIVVLSLNPNKATIVMVVDIQPTYWTSQNEGRTSVTRLGNLLDFGQLFKHFGNYWFVQISHIIRQFL